MITNKMKFILIGLVVLFSITLGIFLYVKGVKNKEALLEKIERLENEITKTNEKNEQETEILGDSTEDVLVVETEPEILIVPTSYEPIDEDPVITCDKGVCLKASFKERLRIGRML